MLNKARFQQVIYFVLALVLIIVAASLWLSHQNLPMRQSSLLTPAQAITIAPTSLVVPTPRPTIAPPPLPTMGYGPLALTPLSAPARANAAVPVASQNGVVSVASLKLAVNSLQTGLAAVNTDLSDRFGVIVTGLDSVPDKATSLKRVLEITGAKWWYQYAAIAPDQPNTAQQVFMVKLDKEGENGGYYQSWINFLRANSTLHNSYWMIGNEPNVPGQDDTPPDVYAKSLHSLTAAIKAVDSTATVIGPNVLNWNYTCKGCPGYTPGQTWFEQMQDAYQSQFQAALPFDAYSMHTYSLDWDNLPLLNHNRDVEQIEAMRTFLDANPDTRNKPMWLSEFGIIWGYDQLGWGKDANGNTIAIPQGTLRTDLIRQYFNDTLGWLKANALRLNLARWFIYTSYGLPEPYSNTFSGISLVDGTSSQANLTDFGKIYVRYLRGQ